MKNGLPEGMKSAITFNEPIVDEKTGVELHPITMRHYETYIRCKSALMIRQTTLPASYAGMEYAKAIYALDRDNGFQIGLMRSMITMLALSTQKAANSFRVYESKERAGEFAEIRWSDGTDAFVLKSKDINRIRRIICAQNGDDLPDESENTELLEAERDIASAKAASLEISVDTLLSSVAFQYRMRVKELLDWPIREFENAKRAVDRDKNYLICALAENSGGKWKGGNPCPSWYADKKREGSIALEPMSDFTKRIQSPGIVQQTS